MKPAPRSTRATWSENARVRYIATPVSGHRAPLDFLEAARIRLSSITREFRVDQTGITRVTLAARGLNPLGASRFRLDAWPTLGPRDGNFRARGADSAPFPALRSSSNSPA